jgi:hypothetical protein
VEGVVGVVAGVRVLVLVLVLVVVAVGVLGARFPGLSQWPMEAAPAICDRGSKKREKRRKKETRGMSCVIWARI